MQIHTSHWTRSASNAVEGTVSNRFPPFDPGRLAPLMPGYHVWDSWFVLKEDGSVARFGDSRVLIALVRPLGADASEKIAYFVETAKGYVPKGFLFTKPIYGDVREWSGSTILRDDGFLQCFYTISHGAEFHGVWQTVQRFATSIQPVLEGKDGLVEFGTPLLHELLTEPDGHFYETAEQASLRETTMPTIHNMWVGNGQNENSCFRDPKFFKDPATGKAFIFFEGNTGPGSEHPAGSIRAAYMGEHSVHGYCPTVDDLKANGCVGVFEFTTGKYTFGRFLKPWLTSNLVTDEIERINVMVVKGKYYLFVAGHGNKNSMLSVKPELQNVDYMLGFQADSLGGPLKPLNTSGVVVFQKSLGDLYVGQEQNQQYTYSWLLVPTAVEDEFECISYASFCLDGDSIKPTKTAGPSVLVKIENLNTSIVDKAYNILPVGNLPMTQLDMCGCPLKVEFSGDSPVKDTGAVPSLLLKAPV